MKSILPERTEPVGCRKLKTSTSHLLVIYFTPMKQIRTYLCFISLVAALTEKLVTVTITVEGVVLYCCSTPSSLEAALHQSFLIGNGSRFSSQQSLSLSLKLLLCLLYSIKQLSFLSWLYSLAGTNNCGTDERFRHLKILDLDLVVRDFVLTPPAVSCLVSLGAASRTTHSRKKAIERFRHSVGLFSNLVFVLSTITCIYICLQ